MAADDTAQLAARHVLRSDLRPQMAKARLPQVRKADHDAWREAIGRVIATVQGTRSLKEFADLVQRDERQVARWISGEDRPQFDAIFAVPELRGPLVIALAELAESIEIATVITIRRSA